jgi:chemotaxis response regulator CheB
MKIGIVNDVAMAAEALRRALALAPEHQIVWTARDGAEAVEMCASHTPDLVLMDLIMPGMGGVEATRRIMAATPCMILIVTYSVDSNAAQVFEAMGYGALDAVNTPALGFGDITRGAGPLLAKIATLGKLLGPNRVYEGVVETTRPRIKWNKTLAAIGASAGGPAAVAIVLAALPKDLQASVVVVQHVDARFAEGMAEWLGQQSSLPVRLAQEDDRLIPGTVLLAGTSDHLTLKSPDRLGYTADPLDYAYRPSVDVFFHSVCRWWAGMAVGVLLTGMGDDGARGLKAMRMKGHHTIAQDQATSAVYGMPKAAALAKAAVEVLPITRVAPRVAEIVATQSGTRATA